MLGKRGRPGSDAPSGADARLLALMEEAEGAEEYVPLAKRRELKERERRARRAGRPGVPRPGGREGGAAREGSAAPVEGKGEVAPSTLLEAHERRQEALQDADAKELKVSKQAYEEEVLLRQANHVSTNALRSKSEIASGRVYTESIRTSWRAPSFWASKPESELRALRKEWHIIAEGEDIPPPLNSFREMKLPSVLVEALARNGIKRPTPIQIQGLPVAFSGRDMIGIAFTGSGKTITFTLPLIMRAVEEELKLPLEGGEGPIGVILCPSRELARQTHEVLERYCESLSAGGLPRLRSLLVVGGESKRSQLEPVQRHGVHCVVATPGRLKDLLGSGGMRLNLCSYLCLDEGDRMLDLGFDEEVAGIVSHFSGPRQTLVFSATMPQKFQDFARDTLVRPVLVNVGRAGAASLDVIQEVEYVKQEAKMVYLLECLQKTAPPVCIFSARKEEVDNIHEYLLLKGVQAVSIHGGRDQSERTSAVQGFRSGAKDVLIATDVAAKGLDFPEVQHVINFDMPDEIENYVHRIGRTGRCGKTGVATTFINKMVPTPVLQDLKHLLIEAKQRIPPVLLALPDTDEDIDGVGDTKGCRFCGGLGHRINNCPKLEAQSRQIRGAQRDVLGGTW